MMIVVNNFPGIKFVGTLLQMYYVLDYIIKCFKRDVHVELTIGVIIRINFCYGTTIFVYSRLLSYAARFA